MSNRIGADVDALDEFRAHLMTFNRELGDGLASIRRHWSSLGSAWDDDMYRRLGDALSDVTPGIDRYLTEAGHHEDYLRELIARLRAALDLHGGW
jgi:hypothetical protein